MAKTAVNQLQEQIEAIRREAFAAGFAAAMQSIREFAAKQGAGADEPSADSQGRRRAAQVTAPANPRPRRQSNAASRTAPQPRRATARPGRGTNARLVEEVLHSNAPRALRPAEIRTAIERDKGVAIAFTSIRHALGQLESRDLAEQVADSKTWRYRDAGHPAGPPND